MAKNLILAFFGPNRVDTLKYFVIFWLFLTFKTEMYTIFTDLRVEMDIIFSDFFLRIVSHLDQWADYFRMFLHALFLVMMTVQIHKLKNEKLIS